jgi:hypothetical protein
MKAFIQVLRALIRDFPAALRAVVRRLCAFIHRRIRPRGKHCDTLNSPVVRLPDPLIYDQYYLMSLGLPITWDNPDISIWQGGIPVAPSDLEADTTYTVVARIWNNSLYAPIAGLPVLFSYLSFGVGTVAHPIGHTTVNLGVKGGPDQPAFASMAWTTPAVAGHYCIQVRLEPAADANWNNNLGQENTHVAAAHSPALANFDLRNDTDRAQRYEFRADAYTLGPLPPCPPSSAPGQGQTPAGLPARLAYLSTQPQGRARPLPSGWQVTLTPERPQLSASEQISVQVTIEPPAGFSGSQVINVHAFRAAVDGSAIGPVLAGGMTYTVSTS